MNSAKQFKRVLILQRVIPSYHVELFKRVTSLENIICKIIIGTDTPKLKAKNASNLNGIDYEILPSKIISLLGRKIAYHKGLLNSLKKNKPSVLICEAESHIMGYLTALIYKYFYDKKVKLVLWCFFTLPGKKSLYKTLIIENYKLIIRKMFDRFLSYHSLGKNFLISKGISEERIVVALNVCDTVHLLKSSKKLLMLEKSDIKKKLGFKNKFIVSYVGTIDTAKNPKKMLEIAYNMDNPNIHFIILGDGPELTNLISMQNEMGLKNVTIFGKISKGLYEYYRSSDIVIVPGRGGIGISEAMCFNLPVITYQADGVELDLVLNKETGFIVKEGDVDEYLKIINMLYESPIELKRIGKNARNLILNNYNIENMVKQISVVASF
tara:strand:+ start:446 stop:1591 length:1146 start_codon:yes stop_codon:yes gene_type:complete